eukprot:CAMPEP_0114282066 /NCGR_PEP_ID=MMETSP0059-20121206/3357_1 /TAXON_ID=36894 /ORGANISM="Pyramimonas parkeae, Strain CCMP726" /LENGTH=448 /DNA_ID=CAMNT_0001402677 /DNA_START=169 /DNA_END=1511 /DNA_ORIENTATION=-
MPPVHIDHEEVPPDEFQAIEGALLAAEIVYANRTLYSTHDDFINTEDVKPKKARKVPASFSNQINPYTAKSSGQNSSLPMMRFGGRAHFICCLEEANAACHTLINEQALGFDMEWAVTYERGEAQRPTALIQLCCGRSSGADWACVDCYLFHVARMGIPPLLKQLLEAEEPVKVGLNAQGDAQKLFRDFECGLGGLVELSALANIKFHPMPPRRWSLTALTQQLFLCQLPKSPRIRCSNWEAVVLSSEQIEYAALDAFAAIKAFQALSNMPTKQGLHPEHQDVSGQDAGFRHYEDSNAHARIDTLPDADLVAKAIATGLPPSKAQVYALHAVGLSVDSIAGMRGLQPSTVVGYIADALGEGLEINWTDVGVSSESWKLIVEGVQRVLDLKIAESSPNRTMELSMTPRKIIPKGHVASTYISNVRLKPIKEMLPETVTYGQIKLAVTYV